MRGPLGPEKGDYAPFPQNNLAQRMDGIKNEQSHLEIMSEWTIAVHRHRSPSAGNRLAIESHEDPATTVGDVGRHLEKGLNRPDATELKNDQEVFGNLEIAKGLMDGPRSFVTASPPLRDSRGSFDNGNLLVVFVRLFDIP